VIAFITGEMNPLTSIGNIHDWKEFEQGKKNGCTLPL